MIALTKPGRIINTASMAAKQDGSLPRRLRREQVAVLGLTQAMAFELAPHGIRVNCVCRDSSRRPCKHANSRGRPNYAALTPTRASDVDRRHAAARLETPNDVAKVVAFLASDDAEFITGEAISVNGGAFMD